MVRDLLGAARSNLFFDVEYWSGNWVICKGSSRNHGLDKAFGDREVDNWFPLSGLSGGVCIDMAPLEEEEDDEEDDEVVRGIGIGTDIRIVKGADGSWHTVEETEADDATD